MILVCAAMPAHANIREGLVGWWRLDETSGTTAIDWSGQNHNGTYNGTTAMPAVQCKRSGCRSFNGSSDYIFTGNIDLNSTNAITIAFWLYKDAFVDDDQVAFELSSNTNLTSVGAMIDPNSSVPCMGNFQINVRGNTDNNTACYTRPSVGTWHQYVAVFDKSLATNESNLYIDGVLQTPLSRPNNFNNGNNFGNVPLYFMSRGGGSYFGSGRLDDVRLYNRALSAQEVSDLYRSGIVLRSGVWRNAKFNQ